MTSATALPDWPALMSIEVACDYLDLRATSFRYMTRMAGTQPVDCHGLALARWRRADLDRMIDSLPARGGDSTVEAREAGNTADHASLPVVDAADLALARVKLGLRR